MARYKPYNYDQLMMVPVSLEEQLVPGTLEYAIHHLIEQRIDTSFFDEQFCNDEEGRTAYDPKVLLKIVLFGYSRVFYRTLFPSELMDTFIFSEKSCPRFHFLQEFQALLRLKLLFIGRDIVENLHFPPSLFFLIFCHTRRVFHATENQYSFARQRVEPSAYGLPICGIESRHHRFHFCRQALPVYGPMP